MSLFKDLVRCSSQHRAFYCYVILSVWIFLLIGGMYKYIGFRHQQGLFTGKIISEEASVFHKDNELISHLQKAHCNAIESIVRKEDGTITMDRFKLRGVLILLRHGDRGPIEHVKGVDQIDCDENDALLRRYQSTLTNISTASPSGHTVWNKPGSFHGFPLLPSHPRACQLGQLTNKGIAQMLHIGEIIKQAYGYQLGLVQHSSHSLLHKYEDAHAQSSAFNPDEIIVYSSRYRRTFQTAMAVLYAVLPFDRWQNLNIRESHSYTFCFSDCACPRADKLDTKLTGHINKLAKEQTEAQSIVEWVGMNVLENSKDYNYRVVRDALMTYICHRAPLPCLRPATKTPPEDASPNVNSPEVGDEINIDQDFADVPNELGRSLKPKPGAKLVDPEPQLEIEECVEPSHVSNFITFTDWLGNETVKHHLSRDVGLLKAYGLLRNIVGYMLKFVSRDKEKFILYSGHDKTMEYLSDALGLKLEHPFVPYASRLVFEVYRSDALPEYYFRLVFNGKDVTRKIEVCEGAKSLRVNRDNRGSKADLCPLENIIRFIHDDYFSHFNETNYKDACVI